MTWIFCIVISAWLAWVGYTYYKRTKNTPVNRFVKQQKLDIKELNRASELRNHGKNY